jgi:hypothetical protein
MTTLAASLAGIGRINFDEAPASFCRFAGQHTKETRPGRVTDAFSQTMIVEHPVDLQIFHCNQPKLVDNLAAVLVREVGSTPANPLVYSGYNLALSLALTRAFRRFGKLALSFSQSCFFRSKEARVFNLLTVREGSKGFKPNINTNLSGIRRQDLRFNPFTAKANVPFAGAGTGQRDRLRLAFEGPVQLNLDMPNLTNNQGITKQLTAGRGLRKGQAIVAAKAFEAGIADFFLTGFNPPEESFHGKFEPDRYVLQDLGMDVIKRGAKQFEGWKFGLLVVQTGGFTRRFITGFALVKPMVINPTAIFELLVEQGFLAFSRPYAVFEGLSHTKIKSSFRLNCKLNLTTH